MKLTPIASVLLTALFLRLSGPVSGQAEGCSHVKIVKCLIEILDDWAWSMWSNKNNILLIASENDCEHRKQLTRCVEDTHDDEDKSNHQCTKKEIIEVSRTVSDLITHRRDSGTFLKTYYLTEYACSTDGMERIKENKECLKTESIGDQTLSAASYLEEKLRKQMEENEHQYGPMFGPNTEEACGLLTEKLNTFRKAIGATCNGASEEVMCKSLLGMFKNLDEDQLGHCDYDCNIQGGKPPPEPPAVVETNEGTEGEESNAANQAPLNGKGEDTGGASATLLSASIFTASILFTLFTKSMISLHS